MVLGSSWIELDRVDASIRGLLVRLADLAVISSQQIHER